MRVPGFPVTKRLRGVTWLALLACGCAGGASGARADVTGADAIDVVDATDIPVRADVMDVADPMDAGDGRDAAMDGDVADGADSPDVPSRGDADWLLIRVDPDAAPSTDRGCAALPGADPALAPARPIAPMNGSRVTSLRPTLQWELPTGVRGVRVELCRDPCCTQPIRTIDADGDRVRPTEALPVGTRVWWRIRGREGQRFGARTGATWLFRVPYRDTPIDTFGGRVHDYNGDGYDDVAAFGLLGDVERPMIRLFAGGPDGLRRQGIRTQERQRTQLGARFMGTGDFNGDGITDFATSNDLTNNIEIHHGGVSGWRGPVTYTEDLRSGNQCNLTVGYAIADVDGDGFSDMVRTVWGVYGERCESGVRANTTNVYTGKVLLIYPGGPEGLSSTPTMRIESSGAAGIVNAYAYAGIGDFNGDGREDLAGNAEATPDPLGRRRSGVVIWLSPFTSPTSSALTFVPPDDPLDLVAGLGHTGTTLGDLDGDRREDFTLNTPGGRVYVFHSQRGLNRPMILQDPMINYRWRYPAVYFGQDLGFSGDINGDGYFDLLVADPKSTDLADGAFVPLNMGRGFLYTGGPMGLPSLPVQTVPYASLPGSTMPDSMWGWAMAIRHLGDLDRDGFDDSVLIDTRFTWQPLGYGLCPLRGSATALAVRLEDCDRAPEVLQVGPFF